MGKLLALAGVIVISFCSSAFADDAINPMVWPQDQWRSELFALQGSVHHRRVAVRREMRIERRVMMQDESGPEASRRARLIRIGEGDASAVAVRSVAGNARHCSGMLVLTVTGNGTSSHCNGIYNRNRQAGP